MHYPTRRRTDDRRLSLLDDFDRLFENVFSSAPANRADETPAVDVREEDDQYVVEADLPGMSEDDVDVHVEGNVLTVRSAAEEENEERNQRGYLVRERRSRSFHRSFTLPQDVDQEKVDARFKNGLLTVTLPKTNESRGRKINVKGE